MPHPLAGDRSAPRDILELRALGTRHPDLTAAAALHAELVTAVRRVESRVTTPSLDLSLDLLQTRLTRGVPSESSPWTGQKSGCSSGKSPTCCGGWT
jgi:hypothetical protein